jgi:predicted RNase H-like HicB family nuclease
MGSKAEALETAKKALELSKEGKNDDYIKMSEALIATLSK